MKKIYKIIVISVICLNTILVCINIMLVLLRVPPPEGRKLDKPLFLTPLIKQRKIHDAQKLAEVQHEKFLFVESYSGYLTVNESTDSHLFFWYFPAEKSTATTPLLLWLNGGPGSSSLYGLFTELGPFIPTSSSTMELREYSWHKHYNLLFFDQPVGTGFSRTKNAYPSTQEEIGLHMYTALVQFMQLFPDIADHAFYITGESYAGKYIPALGYQIHQRNPSAAVKINLYGLAIGNGYTDPLRQTDYGEYLYQHGLIDAREANVMKEYNNRFEESLKQSNYTGALEMYSAILQGYEDLTPNGSLFTKFTISMENIYNYLEPTSAQPEETYMVQFLNRPEIQSALHVGNMNYADFAPQVYDALRIDMVLSAAPWLEVLLEHYRVLLYAGQLDVIVPYALVHNYVKFLNFSAAEQFGKAPRDKWFYDGELVGYAKSAGNLTEVMVRSAGHMVPTDQPKWAIDMLDRFINNKTFS